MTLPIRSNIPLSEQALAGGIARYVMKRHGVSPEDIHNAYRRQCDRDPEDDHKHFLVWLRGWAQTVDMVGKR